MIIDASEGTCILGSRFGRLLTTYRAREHEPYEHSTYGTLRHLDGNWLILRVDDEIPRYYASVLKRELGVDLNWRAKAGAHVSVIRGERLQRAEHWGRDEGRRVKLWYTHQVYTNGEHWWLNVVCDELADIRTSYGLPTNKRFFHLTVGRT